MTDKSRIVKLIKELRVSRELTQEELSKLSGVPFATINRLEQGTANPTLNTLVKVLNVFGYELSGQRARSKSRDLT